MNRRKGELTGAMIDRDWPFQVPIWDRLVVDKHYIPIHEFARSLGACERGQSIRENDEWYVVFCFADEDAARTFALPYAAQVRDARKRRRGGPWHIWRDKPEPRRE